MLRCCSSGCVCSSLVCCADHRMRHRSSPSPSPPSLSATLNLCYCKESIYCPRSNLFEKGICSCGDKLHGAPGWETGQYCPILAVPLSTALIDPLGHFALWFVFLYLLSYLAYCSPMLHVCLSAVLGK
jgi:hypothetical protein